MQLVGYQKAAELLGIKLPTLYSWVSLGRVPHVRFGPRCVRFDPCELSYWIKAHAVESTKAKAERAARRPRRKDVDPPIRTPFVGDVPTAAEWAWICED